MTTPEAMATAIERWFPHAGRVVAVRRETSEGGVELWFVVTEEGRFMARTMDARYDVRGIPFEVHLTRYLAERTPLVPPALVAVDGRSYGEVEGQTLLLFAAAEGERARVHPASCAAAGAALAGVHLAGLTFGPPPRPGQPSWEAFDWETDESFAWERVEQALRQLARERPGHRDAAELAAAARFLRAAREEVSGWLDAARDAGLTFGVVHGSPSPETLLLRDGRPAALVDWRRCRGDWLLADLALAAWEFGRRPGAATPDPARAGELVRAYRAAGGPTPVDDLPWLWGMLRAELLRRACELILLAPDDLTPAVEAVRGVEAVDPALPLAVPTHEPGDAR